MLDDVVAMTLDYDVQSHDERRKTKTNRQIDEQSSPAIFSSVIDLASGGDRLELTGDAQSGCR